MSSKQITILLPCLDEEKTLLECIQKIKNTMNQSKYKNKYTILVCDNNSTDHSVDICKENKIDYIICKEKGYGANIRNGINHTKSEYIVMLDADCSYDDKDIPKMIDYLKEYDFVIGNRFKGNIEKKAMPKKNYIGSNFLSKYANFLFNTPVKDYHCGLRSFKRKEILKCDLNTNGFEFASEMVIKAKLNHLKIKEIPTNLYKDKRDRKPHLKPIKDGIRHFHFINQWKWKNSILFRYLITFSITLLLLFFLLFLSQLIPHKYIEKNTRKSIVELNELFKNEKKQSPNSVYEKTGDIRLLTMIYSEDEKHPLKSLIEMNYYEKCDTNLLHCSDIIKDNRNQLIDYSRYWHGQTIFEKFLLLFSSIKTINIINLILITLLLLLTTSKLFKKDKFLAITFFTALFSTNIFFTTSSIQYIMIFYIVLISSNILITMINKKSKNIDILFLITGMCTCFFDFLTAETLTLTIPLIIYIYLMQKEKNLNLKKLIQFIILWIIGYSLTFFSKWLISFIHYGPDFFKNLYNHAGIRIQEKSIDNSTSIFTKIILINEEIIPFNYLNNGGIIALLLTIISFIYNYLYHKKRLIFYYLLLIPIARMYLLKAHTISFYYYTYRAFSIIIFLHFITIYDILKSIIGEKKDEEE